jgi:Lon-like ATP-dependent protease
MYDTTPPGVVMGLAWTSMGGSALYIEIATPLTKDVIARRQESARVRRACRVHC